MVEHDASRVQAWTETREKTQKQNSKPGKKAALHLSVVAVQSIACCVAVLLAMLLRVAGGEAYRSLRQSFQRALVRNEWVSAMALLWDGDPLEKTEEADKTDGKDNAFTGEKPAQLTGSSVAVQALAPLESGTLTSGYGERIHPIDGGAEVLVHYAANGTKNMNAGFRLLGLLSLGLLLLGSGTGVVC